MIQKVAVTTRSYSIPSVKAREAVIVEAKSTNYKVNNEPISLSAAEIEATPFEEVPGNRLPPTLESSLAIPSINDTLGIDFDAGGEKGVIRSTKLPGKPVKKRAFAPYGLKKSTLKFWGAESAGEFFDKFADNAAESWDKGVEQLKSGLKDIGERAKSMGKELLVDLFKPRHNNGPTKRTLDTPRPGIYYAPFVGGSNFGTAENDDPKKEPPKWWKTQVSFLMIPAKVPEVAHMVAKAFGITLEASFGAIFSSNAVSDGILAALRDTVYPIYFPTATVDFDHDSPVINMNGIKEANKRYETKISKEIVNTGLTYEGTGDKRKLSHNSLAFFYVFDQESLYDWAPFYTFENSHLDYYQATDSYHNKYLKANLLGAMTTKESASVADLQWNQVAYYPHFDDIIWGDWIDENKHLVLDKMLPPDSYTALKSVNEKRQPAIESKPIVVDTINKQKAIPDRIEFEKTTPTSPSNVSSPTILSGNFSPYAMIGRTGADFLSHKFDAYFLWDIFGSSEKKDLDEILEKDEQYKFMSKYERFILSKKGFAVRTGQITVPKVANEDFALQFLETEVRKIKSMKTMNNQSSFTMRLDQNLFWLDMVNAMAGHINTIDEHIFNSSKVHPYLKTVEGMADTFGDPRRWRTVLKTIAKSWPPGSTNNIYNIKDSELCLVVKTLHLSNFTDSKIQQKALPYFVFENVRILGLSDKLTYNHNPGDPQTVTINFIYKRCYEVMSSYHTTDVYAQDRTYTGGDSSLYKTTNSTKKREDMYGDLKRPDRYPSKVTGITQIQTAESQLEFMGSE